MSKKTLTLALLIFFALTMFFQNGQTFAVFFSSFPQKYDIVAILVEKNLYQGTNNYPGLKDRFPALLLDTTIKKRIDRYGAGIQKKLANTRALIIQVDSDEKVSNIANVLEKLYFDGDPDEPNRKSKLVGAVLIGEIPLPTVSKNGNRFLSMFPYTDFEKKAYIFNPETGDFELNKDREGDPKVEIWHGVIRSPDPSNPDLLAQYFDKNYLYSLKHPEFANFGKNMFFSDLFFEKKGINPFGFRNYQNFTKHTEDIAYLRYTKELFKQLYDEMNAKLEEEGLNTESLPPDLARQTEQEKRRALQEANRAACDAARQKVQRECRRGETNECASAKAAKDAVCNNPPSDFSPVDSSSIPDIQTKPLISKYLSEYKDIFNKFLGEINDFVGYTGRYDPKTDLDSPISLITIKDKFTWAYLREVNDMIEREIDRVVAEIEKPIPIIKETDVYVESIKFKLPRGGESILFTRRRSPFEFPTATFSNHSIGLSKEVSASEVFGPQMIDYALATYKGGILGTKAEEIENVSRCSNYRGTVYDPGSGKISKLVEENRVFDIATGTRQIQLELTNPITNTTYTEEARIQGLTTQEQEAVPRDREPTSDYNKNAGSRKYGGCFYDNNEQASLRCFPDLASKPIIDPAGARKLDRALQTRPTDDYRACYFFHEKEQYEDYFDAAAIYLEKLNNEDNPRERNRIPREIPSPYLHPRNIVVFKADVSNRQVRAALQELGFSRPASFQLTLDTVLSEMNLDPNSPSELSNVLFSRNNRQVVRLRSHLAIAEITLKVDPNIVEAGGGEKYISSIFSHKEPTNLTIKAQALAQATTDLPVDNPRHVSFQDRNKNARKIIYPNVFQAKNLEEVVDTLEAKEEEIIAIENGQRPERFRNRLKNLISVGLEQTAFLPGRTQSVIVRADEAKVKDAVLWKGMNLEQKHRYAFLNYLGLEKNPFVAKKQDGYEFLYLNSTGSGDFFDVDFQVEAPKASEEFENLLKNKEEAEESLREERSGEGVESDMPSGACGRDPNTIGPCLVLDLSDFSSPWLRALELWMASFIEGLRNFVIGEPQEEFYTKLHEKQEKDKQALHEELQREKEMEEAKSRVKIISLNSDFPVLSKNVSSKTKVNFALKDAQGAVIKDEAFKITASLDGNSARFSSETKDEDINIPGVQVSVMDGEGAVSLVSTENTGLTTLQIKVDDSELSAQMPVMAVNEAKIVLETNNIGVIANGTARIPINVKAVDQSGVLLSSVNADIALKISDENLGKFASAKVKLRAGQGSAVFLAGKKTGEVILQAGSATAASASLKIQLLPGSPNSLKLFKEGSTIIAKVLDENGNVVTTDSRTEVKFEITPETRPYGRLSNENFARVNNGITRVSLQEGDLPGEVRIKVTEKRNQLASDVISIKSAMRITARDIQENPPNVLFAALLGAGSGNISKPNAFANWFLFSGKTQAVSTLTATNKTGKALALINSQGGVKIQDQRVTANVIVDDPLVIELKDSKFQEKAAEMKVTAEEIPTIEIKNESYGKVEKDTFISVVSQEQEKFRVKKSGAIILNSPDLSANLRQGGTFAIEIKKDKDIVAEIIYPNISSELLTFDTIASLELEESFGGYVLRDKDEMLKDEEAPGFQYNSFEDSLRVKGIGFIEGNKSALLFAGGSSVGEANMPYVSDATIILGDPTVRIDNSKEEGFSSDAGKFLFSASGDVQELLDIDYNTDGLDDLLIVYDDGNVHLFENDAGKGFKDKGLLLQIANKIASIAKGDTNGDARMDIIIAAREKCRKIDTCIDIYENQAGKFIRKNLKVDIPGKVQVIKTADLNRDDKLDLIAVDDEGNIKIYYNRGTSFELRGDVIGNMGLQINPLKNLIPGVLVIYQNGARKYADEEGSPFQNLSTKFARDENGGIVKNNDRITYAITLKNDTNRAFRGLSISDVIPEQLEVAQDSINCPNCEIEKQDDPGRPFIFKNVSVPAGGTFTISYSGIYKSSVEKMQKLIVTVGNNFSDDYNVRDNYLDLAISSEGNASGRIRYFYSTGIDRRGHVVYRSVLSSITEAERVNVSNLDPAEAAKKAREEATRAIENPEANYRETERTYQQSQSADSDRDGIPDNMDNINGTLDTIAQVSQETMSKLKCGAGCLALPINIAFLAPGFFSVLGVPAGFDPGLPVFAWGVVACVATTAPVCIPIWPPNPYQTSVGGRIYLAPTLTGSVGTGICLGPYLAGQCFTFAVDIASALGAGEACDQLSQGIQSAVSKANSAISDLNQGLVLNLGNQQGSGGSANPRESGGLVNYNLGSYEAPVSRSRNTRIPGFPSVITDWFAAQVDEIKDKLLDIPDIYLIYPSLDSLGGAFLPEARDMKIKSIADFLTYLNSIPLLDIEIEEVLFKVPIVTRKDYERILHDFDQWKLDLQLEWDKIRQIWKCATLQSVKDLCKLVDVRVNNMIRTVNENLENLEDWLLFPKRIADYRQIEGYVLRQLVEYLDTIVQYTGGYMKRQKARIAVWEKEIRNMKTVLRNWQALLDIMIDYQESCDKCKSERFTLVELLLKTFVAIPTPPIIPFPKLPDFIIDISKIQAGARVIWPQLELKPVPLILPRLPRIRIPLDPIALPQIHIILPELPVIIPPAPSLPEIPSLPALNLPKFPDFIPPAPKFPEIPSEIHTAISILKKILKIWCIIKTGLIPIPEIYLKSEIETMTSRPLSPLLPIDFLVTVTQPTITVDYVDQIVITAFTNLNIETRYLVDVVKNAAREANKLSQNFADVFNRKMRELQKAGESILQPDLGAPGELWQHEGGINIDLNKINYLDDLNKFAQLAPKLTKLKKENEELVAKVPKEIKLEVSSRKFVPKGKSFDEIKARRIFEDYENEFVKKLADIRDNLIAYVEDVANKDSLYTSASLDFGEKGLKNRLFANTDFVLKEQKKGGKIRVGQIDPKEDASRLVAQANPQPQQQDEGPGNINDIGLFMANPQTGQSQRILAYTRENDLPRKLLFIDYDKDGDKDLAYSSGQDVFLKTYGKPIREERFFHFSEDNIAYFNLENLLPAAPSVNNVKVASQGVKDAMLVFDKSPIQNLGGYTLNAGGRIFDFLVEQKSSPAMNKNIQIKQSRGQIEGEIKDGAIVTIPSGGLLEMNLPDLTYLRAEGPAKFSIPEKGRGKIFVTEGDVTLILPQNREYLLPGTSLQSYGGRLFIQSDGFSYTLDRNEESILPAIEKAKSIAGNVNGSVYIYGKKREIAQHGSEDIALRTSEIIHPLEESEIKLTLGSGKKISFTANTQQSILISDIFGANTKMDVQSGKVEILSLEKIRQRLREGMMIEENDLVTIERGGLNVQYFNGVQRQISSNKEFSFEFLKGSDKPQVMLKLNPGNYYGRVTAFDTRGIFGTSGETVLFALQICADKTPPYADTGQRKYRVPLLKTLELDAAKSFDTQSDVIKFTLDMQGSDISPDLDRDEDNIRTNDSDNPKFILGPFKELGTKKMKLSVFDEAFNEGISEIEIEVVSPEIFIDKANLKAGVISGWIEPPDKSVPITIARFRDNVWDILRRTVTNAAGKFLINDLDLKDRLIVKNNQGKIVAEINRKNGGITITDNRYHLEALFAKPNELPTRIAIVDQNGVILTFVYFVPDVNSDTIIDNPDIEYTKDSVKSMSGVHVKPAGETGFDFKTLPNDDPNLPGATIITLNGRKIAVADVNGDIISFDAQLKLKVKDRNFDDPVVFELWYGNKKIAEIYISVNLAENKFIEIIDAAQVMPTPRPKPAVSKKLPFTDISSRDPLAKTLQDLYEKGIVQGYQDKRGNIFFDKNKQISRAEFTKIVLEILCIKPRAEAKKAPEVFIDIKAKEPRQWFYEYTKEAYLRGFIFGYEGERDTVTGMTPFKPQNTITRAEAVKIILEALESLDEIDLSKINKSAEPWYLPYIEFSQDIKNTYILTKEEAMVPAKKLTRGEFAQIAERVLKMRDCFSFDLDNDSLPDFWEKKIFGGVNFDGDDDPDNDSLTNKEEMDQKTDPLDPDTDQGGIKDGEEVKNRKTNPLDPSDDREMVPREFLRLEEGIFVIRPACISCPCLATITQGAELFKGDIIFASIAEEDGSKIMARSEEITY